jgi:hypothetical protein
MRIRIRILPFKTDADPDPDPDPTAHFSPDLNPPMLQNDPLFHFDADPDADPDPASQNDADPCGSGSATLLTW